MVLNKIINKMSWKIKASWLIQLQLVYVKNIWVQKFKDVRHKIIKEVLQVTDLIKFNKFKKLNRRNNIFKAISQLMIKP